MRNSNNAEITKYIPFYKSPKGCASAMFFIFLILLYVHKQCDFHVMVHRLDSFHWFLHITSGVVVDGTYTKEKKKMALIYDQCSYLHSELYIILYVFFFYFPKPGMRNKIIISLLLGLRILFVKTY